MKLKYKVLIILLVVAAVLSAASLFYGKTKKYVNLQSSPPPDQKVRILNVEGNGLPDGLPADLPTEKDANVERNFTAFAKSDTAKQGTQVFTSKKTIAENLEIYKKYFSENGWKITAQVSQEKYSFLAASKDNQQATLDFNALSNGGCQVRISVTTTQL